MSPCSFLIWINSCLDVVGKFEYEFLGLDCLYIYIFFNLNQGRPWKDLCLCCEDVSCNNMWGKDYGQIKM